MPHANESGNWWQGENSRLASLTAAAIWGGKLSHSDVNGSFGVNDELSYFAQSQIDWILGKNPYQVCMLYGFGVTNASFANSVGSLINGGISSGITGASYSTDGHGITWAEGPAEHNWRWTQQWLEHSAWYLLAITAMSDNTL